MGRVNQLWGNNGMGAASPNESLRMSENSASTRGVSAPGATAVSASGSVTSRPGSSVSRPGATAVDGSGRSSSSRTRERKEQAKIAPVGCVETRSRELQEAAIKPKDGAAEGSMETSQRTAANSMEVSPQSAVNSLNASQHSAISSMDASQRAAINIAVGEDITTNSHRDDSSNLSNMDNTETSLDASQRNAINLALSSDEEIVQGSPSQQPKAKDAKAGLGKGKKSIAKEEAEYYRREPTTRISDASAVARPSKLEPNVISVSGNAELDVPSLVVPTPVSLPPPAEPGAYARQGGDCYRRGDRILVAQAPDLESPPPPAFQSASLEYPDIAAANANLNAGNSRHSNGGLAEAFPVSDRSLHLADPDDPNDVERISKERETKRRRFNQTFAFVGCALLLVIVVLAFVFGLSTKSESASAVLLQPTNVPTSLSPTMAPTAFLIDLPGYTTEVILMDHNKTSPQSRAYQWMLNDPNFNDYPQDRLLQRFALATLFYSTIGEDWAKGSPTFEVVAEKPKHKPKGAKPRPIPALLEAPLPPPDGNITRNEANWLDYNVHECLWYNRNTYQKSPKQVETCDWEGRYKYLFLDVNNLWGTLCPELALLTNLQALGVAGNYIEGTIPTQLFAATPNMTWLVVEKNRLTGTVPSQLGLWPKLNNLRIMNNDFEGTLPKELFGLSQMNSVMIGGNRLTGSIPPQMGSAFPNLVKLDMPDNKFSGTLPSQLGLLKELRILDAYYNQLTGTIPSQLGLAAKLAVWQMQANQISGRLPSQLGLLEAMEVLNLEKNAGLTGTIPNEMGPLAVSLDLPIPSHLLPPKPGAPAPAPAAAPPEVSAMELGRLLYLQVFDIRDTGISGVIPTEYCNTTTMEQLEFNCSAALCGCGCNCSSTV